MSTFENPHVFQLPSNLGYCLYSFSTLFYVRVEMRSTAGHIMSSTCDECRKTSWQSAWKGAATFMRKAVVYNISISQGFGHSDVCAGIVKKCFCCGLNPRSKNHCTSPHKCGFSRKQPNCLKARTFAVVKCHQCIDLMCLFNAVRDLYTLEHSEHGTSLPSCTDKRCRVSVER